MIPIVLNSEESLTAVMSGAANSTNPTYSATWRGVGSPLANQPVGSLNGTTAVTLVSGDPKQRQVEAIDIYNGDDAAVTVTLAKVVGGTSYTLGVRTLASGSILQIDDQGLEVFESSTTLSGVGAAAGTNVTASEQGAGVVHQTLLTLDDMPLTVTDALAYASQKIYDFPEGRILVLGVTANMAFAVTSARASTINDNAAMDWAIGTAAASNVSLTTTMVDLIPKQDKTLDGAVAAYTSAQGAALAASAQFDGTTTAKDAYLNVSFPTTTDIDADGTMTIEGTAKITWINLGDF